MFIPFNVTTLILKSLFGVFVLIEAIVFGIVCLPFLVLHWLFLSLGLSSKEEVEEDYNI